MKKDTINIFLVIFLVFIWGAVIKKYFLKKEVKRVEKKRILYSNNNYINKKDTFKLEITNLNPFKLKKEKVLKKIIKKNKTNVEIQKSKKTYKYYGFVKSKKNKSKLILLRVDNKLYRKREREKIGDITILKAYSDSLFIRESLNKIVIKKQ